MGTILAVPRTDAWHSLEGWKVLPQLHLRAEGRIDASSCICWKSKCFPRISLRAFAQTLHKHPRDPLSLPHSWLWSYSSQGSAPGALSTSNLHKTLTSCVP